MKLFKYSLILLWGLLIPMMAAAQGRQKVTGTIRDSAGEPLIGVVVVEKGQTRNGTTTAADGTYSITIKKDGFLEVSCLGFKTIVEPVKGREVIDLVLQSDNEMLEATVVIGYGTSKKGDLTGSVAVVDMEDIQQEPVTSVGQALQGRIAGAEFSSGTGEAGESGQIRIRGTRSISAGNEPLIVVDGVIDAVSSLSDINPSDIVSISLLKDVSSTAIYGSRGANGVILVTTQASKNPEGGFAARFKSTLGVSHLAGSLDIMNAEEYATFRNMVSMNVGSGSNIYSDPSAYRDSSTDWIKALTRPAFYQNYHLNLHGMNGGNSWTASLGYNDAPGIVLGSGVKKYTGTAKIISKIKRKLTLNVNVNFSMTDKDNPKASVTGTSTTAAVYLSPMLGIEDTWNPFGEGESYGGMPFNSPYLLAKNVINNTKTLNWGVNGSLRYNVNARFWAEARGAWNSARADGSLYSPSYMAVAKANGTGGTARRSHWDQDKFLGEITLHYKRSRSRRDLEALLGFTAEQTTTGSESYSGSGFMDDSQTFYNLSGIKDPAVLSASSTWFRKTKLSVLGRVKYNYKRRYYLTVTARADGASNFAANKKWGFFPAAAFRWSVMNEKWFSKSPWLNDLSLRLSAGRSGNDAISAYQSMATLSSTPGTWLFGDDKYVAVYPAKLQNSSLTWETTDALNAGLDFAAWQNRVRVELEGYVSWTNDLLLSVRNAQTTGYNTYYANAGSTRNAGVELTLTTNNIKRKNFVWTTTLTASHNAQIVTHVASESTVVPTYLNPRNNNQWMYGYREGYPVNALWGYKYEGVWHNMDEYRRNEVTHAYVSQIREGTQGTALGKPKYADINHDGMLDQNDVVYLGSSDALVYGGFQNNFTLWKNLTVGVYFTWSIGGKIYNINELWAGSGYASYNKYRYMLNAWTPDNPDSDLVKAGFDDFQASSRLVHDASFFRLKSLSVNYKFPLKGKVKRVMRELSVGASAENLFLLKNYNGFDPDVSTSSAVFRLDNGSLPRPRTYVVNLNVLF